MRTQLSAAVAAGALLLGAVSLVAQSGVSGVFFNEGWESGTLSNSFNSSAYGNAGGSSQFRASGSTRATGAFAFEHVLPQGTDSGSVQYATQHFGDARTGPVLEAGRGQSFQNVYVQWRVYYPDSFDFSTGYKQFIIGTQDDTRHDNPCCNPWVAHYMTIFLRNNTVQAEANNKQASSGQWVPLGLNQNGYNSTTNAYVIRTGRWYTFEVRRQLNSGGDNGIFQMWIDGLLVADHRSVRYRIPNNGSFGTNMAYGTNFAMISDYAYATVTRNQSIFYDDVKFSTTYIGASAGGPPSPPTNLRIVQ